jgi:protoporphyrinogen oxidase
MSEKKVLIIGAGPAGLTAAYEILLHTDMKPIVLEMSNVVGGISQTVNYKGNRIDIGGHRFFSKSDAVMQWWNSFMAVHQENDQELKLTYQNQTKVFSEFKSTTDLENVMLVRKRKSRIIYGGKFYDYPISLSVQTIRNLGLFNTIKIGFSYFKSVIFPIKNETTLEDFFINRFGKELYLTFFKDYTEKVWGISCDKISSEWGAQRIKGLSISKTISHFFKSKFSSQKNLSQKNVETSLIEYFLYPKLGPGQMWECVRDKVIELGGEVISNNKVNKIEIDDENRVKGISAIDNSTGNTVSFEADYCISTMPVDELLNSLNCEIPKEVKKVSDNLLFRDFITVGILLKKMNESLDDNWIYIQEPSVKVGRIQIFNNWSPYLVKDENTHWLGLEYFCNKGDSLWNLSETELKDLASKELQQLKFCGQNDVIDSVVIRMPKTYPAYFGSYNQFDTIRNFTDTIKNLFLVGRNGMHKYNNQDHSMLTAMEAVQLIKNNNTSKDSIWSINTEQEYHEEK